VLDSLRKNASESLALKIIFGVIVVVFMFWGIGTVGLNQMQLVAKVNDEVITAQEFNRAYQSLSRAFRKMSHRSASEAFLRKQTLEQLINAELLSQEAHRLGLRVGEDELRDSIAAIPAFQVDGHFDKRAYLNTLQANGLKPADFEESQRRQLLVNKLQELVSAGVHVTDAEVKERYRYENARVELRFVRIPAASFRDQVTIDDAELQKYFADNQDRFREPERVRISYLLFRPEDFAAEVKPTDDDVRVYYDSHQEEYRKPEEVRARHILFKVPADATEEQKTEIRKRAGEVLERAKAGEDFAALAREYSQDATAAEGGDLGFFARGVMSAPFDEAAFQLAPGDISGLVETPAGLEIIKVEDKHPGAVEPLEAVRKSIVEAIQKNRARGAALQKAENAQDRLLDGDDLAAVATDVGLTVQTTPPFARDEPVPGLGKSADLVKSAFATPTNEAGEIVTLDSGYVVFRVGEHIDSYVPELDAIRDKVEAVLREKKAEEAAAARAKELLEKLKAGKSLEALAQQEDVAIEETGPFGRSARYISKLGSVPDLERAAFRLTQQDPVAPAVYSANGDAVVAVLAKRIPADESKFDSEKEALKRRMQQRLQMVTLQQFLSELKNKAEIELGQGYTTASSKL
jgi:peptidyl-prolyl cis-trans isomerase D